MATSASAPKGHKKQRSQNLQDQAATAALYVTNAGKQNKSTYPLDADNRLSSASAATSLKHANPKDLPSFPSVGLSNSESSAGAAASLAAANQKAFEHWKPEHSEPANQAAMLAKDYKATPLWQPETSAAGSKAALLAAKTGANVNIWQPDSTKEGNSAAGLAMRNKSASPPVDTRIARDKSNRALMAATGAMSGRQRSDSSPAHACNYPDSANSAANALNAATKANRPPKPPFNAHTDLPGLSAEDAARIHNAAVTNMSREMYTANPPVGPELEERNRQAGLRAAAVSMAKSMYDVQQKALQTHVGGQSDSHHAANTVHNRKPSTSEGTDDLHRSVDQYVNLQEAARKLAAERLAKLDEGNTDYRDYYGTNVPARSRLSMRGRRRASSDGQVADSDQARSQRIRSEMSLFNSKVAEVDAQKRQKDRESLMAAAKRNVTRNMQGMDEQVFADTGRVSAATKAEWEVKARNRAEEDSKSRMLNYGKVDIGGGRYLEQAELEAIAASKVQPTLDEITKKAEEDRARDEARRQALEEQRRIAIEKVEDDKERAAKTKEEWQRMKEEEKLEAQAAKEEEKEQRAEEQFHRDKRADAIKEELADKIRDEKEQEAKTKEEWKRLKEEEKHEAKARKEEEKARKAEEKRLAKEREKQQKEEERARKAEEKRVKDQEKRKSRGGPALAAAMGVEEREKEKDSERPTTAGGIFIEPKDEKSDETKDSISPEPSNAEPSVKDRPLAPSDPAPSQSRTEPLPVTVINIPPTGSNQIAVTGGQHVETSPKDKEQGKVSSWLKSRFTRRGSRSIKPEDTPIRSAEARERSSSGKHEETSPTVVTEPVTGLPLDPRKAEPGFGTNDIPHILAAESTEIEHLRNTVTGQSSLYSDVIPGTSSDTAPVTVVIEGPNQNSSPVSPVEAETAVVKERFADPSAPGPAMTYPISTPFNPAIDLNSSERDVAMAGRQEILARSRSTSISSLSSDEPTTAAADPEAGEGARGREEAARKSSDITQESSVDVDEFEEARDRFDLEQLSAPSFPNKSRVESPARETRFKEEL